MKMFSTANMNICGVCVICLLLLHPVESNLSINNPRAKRYTGRSISTHPRGGELRFPGIQNKDKNKELEPDVIGKLYTTVSIVYGGMLMIYGQHFPAQLQAVTVMRIAGFPRFQVAVQHIRQNYRRANLAVYRHATSLMGLEDTLNSLGKRADEAQNVLAKTREAKADGIVTAKEERQIRKMQKQQLRTIRSDIRRIKRGSRAMIRLWDTLDLDEIWEMFEDFLFMATAVLATGNSNSIVGTTFAKYCYFLSLGSLFRKTDKRFYYPFSRMFLWLLPFIPGGISLHSASKASLGRAEKQMQKDLKEIASACSAVGCYVVAAYVVCLHHSLGIVINDCLMVAYMLLKSIELVTSNSDFFKGWKGGVWMLSVSFLSFYNFSLAEAGNLPLPQWLEFMTSVESMLSGVVKAAQFTSNPNCHDTRGDKTTAAAAAAATTTEATTSWFRFW